MADKNAKVEWMCTNCGRKEWRVAWSGRPMPGSCPKKKIKGQIDG